MKRTIYFTSDQHFNHDHIIDYCSRPFSSIEEMNSKLVDNYNKTVKKNDICYFLGDLGFKSGFKDIIHRLNGKKILIKGNHDKNSDGFYYSCGFDAVLDYAEISTKKHTFRLHHIPTRSYSEFIKLCGVFINDMLKGKKTLKVVIQRIAREIKWWRRPNKHWSICGHVHEKWLKKGKNINCGVDVWGFKPVSINKIMEVVSD